MKETAQSQNLKSKSEILIKAQNLVNLIQTTDTFAHYKQAENKLDHHPQGKFLLVMAKTKRNNYSQTSLRHGYEHPASIKAKEEYDEVLQQMEDVPIIEEYTVFQEELNELLQGVTRTIINTLSPDIQTEVFEQEAEGSGGCGGGCGSCKSH